METTTHSISPPHFSFSPVSSPPYSTNQEAMPELEQPESLRSRLLIDVFEEENMEDEEVEDDLKLWIGLGAPPKQEIIMTKDWLNLSAAPWGLSSSPNEGDKTGRVRGYQGSLKLSLGMPILISDKDEEVDDDLELKLALPGETCPCSKGLKRTIQRTSDHGFSLRLFTQ